MAQINVTITLDNVEDSVNLESLADTIENIIKSYTKMESSTTIYDSDPVGVSNPIMTHNTLRKIRR